MPRPFLLSLTTALVGALASIPSPVAAQAFGSLPRGVGAVTLSGQYIDNTGHRGSDGFFVARGQSVSTSILAEIEYGVTDRLSATLGLPYVFAKYTGAVPTLSQLPTDTCRCWQSGFQDVSVSVRYRLGGEGWAVTPLVRYTRPSHDYPFRGEAVVGANLQHAQVGVVAGSRLVGFLPRASVQAGYTYAFVEKPLPDFRIDRSTGFVDLGYAAKRSLFVRAGASGHWTHGGVNGGTASGRGVPFPGEFTTPETRAQRDRLISTRYLQVGGGLAYSAGPVDVFASFTKYVWGRNSHNGQAYTAGATWYFDLSN